MRSGEKPSIGWLRILVLVLAVGGVWAALQWLPRTEGPFWAAIFLFALALPAGIFVTYLATLKRLHIYGTWDEHSILIRFFSGPWVRFLVGVILAIFSAVMLGSRLSVAGLVDGTLLVVFIGSFVVLWYTLGTRLRRQWRLPYRDGRALFWAGLALAFAFALADPLVRIVWVGAAYDAGFWEVVAALGGQDAAFGSSALSTLMTDVAVHLSAAERTFAQFASEASSPLWWPAIAVALASLKFPMYLATALSVSAFFLPKFEYSRIILPVGVSEEPPRLTRGALVHASTIFSIVFVFLYLPLVALSEVALRKHLPSEPVSVIVEQIGHSFYRPGTIEEIERARVIIAARRSEIREGLEEAFTDGFEEIRANVEVYLDWYYSLVGEGIRVLALLAGDLEARLVSQIEETLGQGEPFARFEEELERFFEQEGAWEDEFILAVRQILDEGRLEVMEETGVIVTARMEMDRALSLARGPELTDVLHRFGASVPIGGVGGVVTAAVVRQVAARLVGQGVIRFAAAALVRVVGARLGGILGGAATGAAAGSVVPGVGTGVGFVVGGIAGGLAIGTGAWYLVLKLEEAFSRDDHRAEIVGAIDQTEAELRKIVAPIFADPQVPELQ